MAALLAVYVDSMVCYGNDGYRHPGHEVTLVTDWRRFYAEAGRDLAEECGMKWEGTRLLVSCGFTLEGGYLPGTGERSSETCSTVHEFDLLAPCWTSEQDWIDRLDEWGVPLRGDH